MFDDLVDDIVAVFDDAPTLDGGAGQAVVTRIGDEDRVDIGVRTSTPPPSRSRC